jgi:uncharacterized repeat protein (TIGR01451 family)
MPSGTITCTRSGSTAVGALPNVVVTVKITSAGGSITNAASISATEADPNSSNNTASTSTILQPGADLQITQSPTGGTIATGSSLVYTLTAKNNGPSAQDSITVTDTLSANVTYVSAAGTGWICNQASGVVTCSMAASLASGQLRPQSPSAPRPPPPPGRQQIPRPSPAPGKTRYRQTTHPPAARLSPRRPPTWK